MALPPLQADGTLPPGRHQISGLDEIFASFPAVTTQRQILDAALTQLVAVISQLRLGTQLVIDGSYLSGKLAPNDIDGVLLSTGLNEAATLQQLAVAGVDLMLLDLFVVTSILRFDRWVQFFSQDRAGNTRGVILLTI